MTPREQEVADILAYNKSMKQEIYRGANFTWANKFRHFYKGRLDVPNVPASTKLFIIASRKPIAKCVHALKGVIDYKLVLSLDWKKQVDAMHRFFQENHISFVYVDEDISIIKNLFVQVARVYGVKSAVQMHGALVCKWGFLPLTADEIHVWDNRNKVKLTSWGLEPDRVRVMGYEKHYQSRLNKLSPEHQVLFRKEFKIEKSPVYNREPKIILFAPYMTNNYGDGYEKEIAVGINWIKDVIHYHKCALSDYEDSEFINAHFIIKLHPANKDFKMWAKWIKDEMINSTTLLQDYDADLIAYCSDLMVVQSSTYAIDGMVMDKNVIVIDSGFSTGVEEYGERFDVVNSYEKLMNRVQFFGR